MSNPCRAQNPSVCPYHRNVYGFDSPQKLGTKMADLANRIRASKMDISPTSVDTRRQLESQYMKLRNLYDATPDGRRMLKNKIEQVDRNSVEYMELASREHISNALVMIRRDSEPRLTAIRNSIDNQKFATKQQKLNKLTEAVYEEYNNLGKEFEKNVFFLNNKTQKVNIQAAYGAARGELLAFAEKLTSDDGSLKPSLRESFVRKLDAVDATHRSLARV